MKAHFKIVRKGKMTCHHRSCLGLASSITNRTDKDPRPSASYSKIQGAITFSNS